MVSPTILSPIVVTPFFTSRRFTAEEGNYLYLISSRWGYISISALPVLPTRPRSKGIYKVYIHSTKPGAAR
jgi:hypothetical protein